MTFRHMLVEGGIAFATVGWQPRGPRKQPAFAGHLLWPSCVVPAARHFAMASLASGRANASPSGFGFVSLRREKEKWVQ